MAIELVDFSIKHGDFPLQNVSSSEGIGIQFAMICHDTVENNHHQKLDSIYPLVMTNIAMV